MADILGKEEKVISTFLRSIGPWRKHVVIGGGYAPIIYKLYFNEKSPEIPPLELVILTL